MSNPFEKYVQASQRQTQKLSGALEKWANTPSTPVEAFDTSIAGQYADLNKPITPDPTLKSVGDYIGDTATDAAKALLTAQGVAVSAVDLGMYSLGGLGSLAQTIGHTVAPDTIPEVVVPEFGVGSKALNDTFGVNITAAKKNLGDVFYSDARKKQEEELHAGYTEQQMGDWKKTWEDSYATQLIGLQQSGATEQQLKDFNTGFNKQYQDAAKQFIASKQTSWDKSFGENASIVGDAFGYVADNPSLGVGAAIDSLGYLLPSLAVSKGVLALQNAAKAASVGGKAIAAGVSEGSVSSLAIAEQMRNNSTTGTIGGDKLLAAAAAGTLTGLIGGASTKLGARLGLADVDTAGLAALGTGAATRLPALTRPIAAIGQEGGEEFLQGFGETIIPNIAEGKDPLAGLSQELALGTFAGGIMGAGMNAPSLVSGGFSDISSGLGKVKGAVSDAASLKTFDTLSNPEHKNYNPAQAFNSQLKNLESNDETVRTQAQATVDKIATDLQTTRAQTSKQIAKTEAALKAMPPVAQMTDAQKVETAALRKEYDNLQAKSDKLSEHLIGFLEAQVMAQENRDAKKGTEFTEEQAKADIAILTQSKPSQTVWRNADVDMPVEVVGEPETHTDGTQYSKVRYADSFNNGAISESYVPTSELVSVESTDTTAQQEALDRVTRHFSKYSNDDLDLLATSPIFNEQQRNSLRLMSESKRQLAAVQDPSQVFDNILNGYKGKTIQESHRGLNQYTDMVNTAVATKNEQLASLALDGLGAFTDDHTAKRDTINEAFKLVQKGTYAEVHALRTQDGTWGLVPFTAEEVKAGKNAAGANYLSKAELNKVGGFNVHINSDKKGAITQINDETQLIQDRFAALSGVAESFVGVALKPVVTAIPPVSATPPVVIPTTEVSQRSPRLEEAYKETFSKPIENWDASDFAAIGAQAAYTEDIFDNKNIEADNAFSQKMAKKIIADGIAKNRSTADIMQDVMFTAYSSDFAMKQSGVDALNAYIELRKAQGTSNTPIVTEPSDTTAPVDNPAPEAPVQSDVVSTQETITPRQDTPDVTEGDKQALPQTPEDTGKDIKAEPKTKTIDTTPPVSQGAEAIPEKKETSTESQVEPVGTEDAKITVLRGVTDEIAAEERKKPFNLRNILKGYFKQSTTKEDGVGANPLVTVKDFLSNFDVRTQVGKWLNDRRKPTEKQIAQVEHFKKFHVEFAKALNLVFNTQVAAKYVSNMENLVGYLEMGKKVSTRELDENVITALALSAYSYLIKQGNKVMNTNEELETLFRLKKGVRAPFEIEQMFRFAGQEMPIVVKALGTDAAKALGLKVREDQDPTLQDRLNTSLGILAMEAMAKAGFVVIDTLEGEPLKDFLTAIKTVRESKAHTSEDEYDFEVDTDVETEISKFTMVRPNALMEGESKTVFDGNRPALTEGLPTLNSPLVRELIEANKDTKGFLSYLFGVDVGLTTPLKEIPKKFSQKLINGTDASVPSVQAELLTEAQKHSFTMRTNTVAVFAAMQKLGESSQFLKEVLGIWIDDHVLSRTHVVERDSLQAKAQNDWTAVLNGLEWADATLDENGQYQEFYDTQFVAQNQRQHLNSNMFSAQSSQIHRAMAALTGFSTTIDLSQDGQGIVKDEALLNLFYQAVGEGLEGLDDYLKADILSKAEAGLHQFFTVDKVYGDYYVPALKAFLETTESKVAIKAMGALIETGTIDTTQQKAIAAFVDKGKMGAQSLQSLIALAELDIAQTNGTTFTTTIGFGSDGVNHGVSAANMLTGVISKDMRQQTGIFPIAEKGQDQISNMQEVYKRKITDYYVDFGKVMAAKLRDLISTFVGKLNTDFVDGMKALFPKFEALGDNGELTDLLAMRKIAKIWAIPFNYSAGKAALQRALARGFLAGIYGDMNKLANKALDIIDAKGKKGITTEELVALDLKLATVQEQTNTLQNNLNKVLRKYGMSVTLPAPELLNEEAKGKLSTELENTLMQAAIDLHGEAAWQATEEFAEKYLQVRNVYTEVEKASFTLFDLVRTQLIAEKKASRKYSNVAAKVQVRGKTVQYTAEELNAQEAEYFELTTTEMAEVDAVLAAMRPMFNTALSIGSESTNDTSSTTNPSGVSVRKHKMQREPASGLRAVSTFYGSPRAESRNIGLTKVVEENAGVASSANAVQSIDAYVAAKVQGSMDALNVHDAAIFGLKNFLKGVKKQNEEHLKALTNYQLGLEHAKMLVKVYQGYKAFMATQELALKSEDATVRENAQKLITKANKQIAKLLNGEVMEKNGKVIKIDGVTLYKGGLIPKLQAANLDIGNDAKIEEAISAFINFALKHDLQKLEVLLDTYSIHQFAGEGGTHKLTKADKASIEKQKALVQKALSDLGTELTDKATPMNTTEAVKPITELAKFLRKAKGAVVDIASLIEHLTNNTDIADPRARAAQLEVLKAITPLIDKATKVVYSEGDYEGYGYYDEGTNTLHINSAKEAEGGVRSTLAVHELLHAALSRRIKTLNASIEIKEAEAKKTGKEVSFSPAEVALQNLEKLRVNLVTPAGMRMLELQAELGSAIEDSAQFYKETEALYESQKAENTTTIKELQALNKEEARATEIKGEIKKRGTGIGATYKAQLEAELETLPSEEEIKDKRNALLIKQQAIRDTKALLDKANKYFELRETLSKKVLSERTRKDGSSSKFTQLNLVEMLNNLDEFISYGLTESRLQEAMKSNQVDRGGRTFSVKLRKFVEFVGQVFGFRTHQISALAAFASDTAALLETIGSVTPGVASNTVAKAQIDAVRKKYAGTKQWMKAPNGKPTKLSEVQWLQVRTPNFKAWFGDWENDPANASKVVDENGEPLVMYHGTTQDISEFKSSGQAGGLLFFTSDIDIANAYAEGRRSGYHGMAQAEVRVAVENVVKANPQNFSDLSILTNTSKASLLKLLSHMDTDITSSIEQRLEDSEITAAQAIAEFNEFTATFTEGANVVPVFIAAKNLFNTAENPVEWKQAEKSSAESYKAKGNDGVYVTESDGVALAVFDPTQVKSAIGNTGEFSATSPSIHYSRTSAEDLVNGQSFLDIMQALPHSNTGAFNQQLGRLIVGEIGQLYNQDDAAKARIDELQTFTASDALNAGFTLSRKEQYVQQALQYAVAAYMKLHAGGANVGQLRRVYHAAKVKISPTGKDFHEGDWATATQQEKDAAKAKYDFLFDSTKEGYMGRFVSMALASESVSKILDIALPLTKPETQDKTWFETVSDWVSYVMAWLTNKYVRLNPVAGASNQLVQLMDNLVKLDIRARQEGVSFHQKAWNSIGLVTTPLNNFIKKGQEAALKGDSLTNSRFLPVRALGAAIVLRSEEAAKVLPQLILDMRNNQLPHTKLGEAANILMEAASAGSMRNAFDVLIRQTNLNAKNRQDIVDNVKKAVNGWFKTPLTKLQHKAITYGLLRTDAQALLENYSVEDVVDMALHEGKLNAEIAKLKKEIAKNPNGNDMLNAAEQLGYYMVTRIGGEGLVKNATGIAIGLGTQYFTSVEQADAKLVQQLDMLASMIAMTYVSNSEKGILAALYKTDKEGIHATITLHNGLVTQATGLFQDNPLNKVKGWMPEIVNPFREIKVAESMVEREQMEAEGWIFIDEVKRDTHDKGSAKYLMKHSDIGYQRYVSGSVDLLNPSRSGTEAISRTSPKYLSITQVRYQNAVNRAAIPNGSFDPTKQPRGLITAYDTDGVALAYNYEMDNETRDTHLDRNHNIGDLMGTFGGKNYYTPIKTKQNSAVAKVLFEDYRENYSQNPNAYIKLSPKSTDPKVVEMWRMLPQDFKDQATALYGKGNPIVIRNEAFNFAFGFKKFSVVSYAFDAVNAERARIKMGLMGTGKAPNAFQSGFVRFAEATRKGTAQADFAKAEHVTQEIVKAIKDFIVIRSGTTMMWNIFANVLMLMANGINPVTIVKDWVFAVTNVRAYQKLNSQLIQAQADLVAGKDPVALKQKIGALKAELKANVMNQYINAGLLSSIVEDVNIQKGDYTYNSEFKTFVDEKTQWIPKKVKTAAAIATIAPSTKLYQFLATITQLSDFVAKYTMSKHLQSTGMAVDESIVEASKTFINYDLPTSQGLQYANDMGLFMFTKFFLRIQAVLMKLLGKRAGSVIAQHILVESMTGAEGILSPSLFNHIGNNPLESSVFGLPSAFFSIGTVDAVTGAGGAF